MTGTVVVPLISVAPLVGGGDFGPPCTSMPSLAVVKLLVGTMP